MIEFTCLDCNSRIQQQAPDAFACGTCGRTYRAVLGMPDLRVFAPPYLSLQEDWRHAQALAKQYERLDFGGLLRYKYEALYPHYDASTRQREIDARVRRQSLAEVRRRIVTDMLALIGREIPREPLLDIGCGTGPFVRVMAPDVTEAVGIDISMEELVLARKRVEEAGVLNFRLAAACAERLPFANGGFGLAHAMDVIEHVRDPVATVREVMRVVRGDGVFSFNSPNRLDLLNPEPHVDLRFVGFWPRALQEPYVKLLTGREYKAKRLLSLPELQAVLQQSVSAGEEYRIAHWYRLNPAGKGSSWLGRSVRRAPALVTAINRVWGMFLSQHEAVVWHAEGTQLQPRRSHVIVTAYGTGAGKAVC